MAHCLLLAKKQRHCCNVSLSEDCSVLTVSVRAVIVGNLI